MIAPPALMDPVALAFLAVLAFVWLYSISYAQTYVEADARIKPFVNAGVVLSGPLALAVLLLFKRRLRLRMGLANWITAVRVRLGRGSPGGMTLDAPGLLLYRSDGQPITAVIDERLAERSALPAAAKIVEEAVRLRASDILLDPKQDQTFQLRYRVDGLLREPQWLESVLAQGVINCYKILADMNIAERRRSQDGALMARTEGRAVQLRVATASTLYGEKIAIRVQDAETQLLRLHQIGLHEDYLRKIREFIRRPYGMLAVCGPTGSGKTTTLYAALNELSDAGRNVVTIEDPIEFPLEFASQTAVNAKAGITFAGQLRHVLRQTPDVIMIGEMRDAETARIALQSSETGHLVFSTVHGNDAPTGLLRLMHMGIEPYLLASGLKFVLAQRLVRRLCAECRVKLAPTDKLRVEAEARRLDVRHLYDARSDGCKVCGHTGYLGRTGIFELLEVTRDITERLLSGTSLVQLQQLLHSGGWPTMRHDGVAKVLAGQTSLAEVLRVTVETA